MHSNENDTLHTWKEIASYLHVTVRTCYRWEKTYGMPVYRIENAQKSRLYASKTELDEWRQKQFLSGNRSQNHLFSLKWLFLILPIGSIGVVLLLVLQISNNPIDFKINGSNLIIINKHGKKLWNYDSGIENLSTYENYESHYQYKRRGISSILLPHLIIKKLDNDGKIEVLFSIQTQDEFNEGKLICFDFKGKTLWIIEIGADLKYGNHTISNDYRIEGFDICDIDNDGRSEIFVIASHRYYFPSLLLVLNSSGEKIAEYWNSGRLLDIAFIDLDLNGNKEVIVAGMNNEYKKACLIVFNPSKIEGSSPQYNLNYKCETLRPGTEQFYILFPRTEIDLLEYEYETIRVIDTLNNKRLSANTKNSNIFFEFSYQMKIQDIKTSNSFDKKYKMYFADKKTEDIQKSEFVQKLMNSILYYDGRNWISKPTMTSYWNKE
jgi:hypothetical protein